MTRQLVLSNSRLLVNFDHDYLLRDLYWPHVGDENHTGGQAFPFGVHCDGQFSWGGDPSWDKQIRYDGDTLVGQVTLRHQGLGLTLVCYDMVDLHMDLCLRYIEVMDSRQTPPASPRRASLFFVQNFHIYGRELGDTAYYEPDRRAVLHYKSQRWFMIDVARKNGDTWRYGVDEWTVGQRQEGQEEGPARDAEDGKLAGRAVTQGSVSSVVALHLEVPAGGRTAGWYWIAAGQDFEEVARIDAVVRRKGPDTLLTRTRSYWTLWVRKEGSEESDLPERLTSLYRRSLLTLRAHSDNGGGIVAATDFAMSRESHDTYAYVWPRDGALAAAALVRAGYSRAAERFFHFCHTAITPDGYMLQKYNPDGSLASTWEGWYYEGRKVLPVQADETALVFWALRAHFDKFRDVEFIRPLYEKLVVGPADWMAEYVDDQGLPQPSWDLWEERRGVHAWTAGAVWAGLKAAARFAADFGDPERAGRYDQTADRMKQAVAQALWDDESHRFVRSLRHDPNGQRSMDKTLDSSLAGLWYFGMFEPGEERITATMEAVRQRLWVPSAVGGMARYENDQYRRVDSPGSIPGNPWFVCTLWLAQWYIRKAARGADLEPAARLVQWAASRALPNGLMAEQIHPAHDVPLSACPLTWSHSTFVVAVHEYAARCRALHCDPHLWESVSR